MRVVLALVLSVVFSLSIYAEESEDVYKKRMPSIMEMILFLNANQANNGSASMKTDYENKTLEYLDKDGKLMEKSYIDSHNDIVNQKFGKDGKVVSEMKITEASVMAMNKQNEIDHEQKEVPELKAKLAVMSAAAENYAKANGGKYPPHIKDLTQANPPYLDPAQCTCGQEDPTYGIICELDESGYKFKANSLWPHLESYVVSTGGKPEMLPRGSRHEQSAEKCE